MFNYNGRVSHSQIYNFRIVYAQPNERRIDLELESDSLPGRYKFSIRQSEARNFRKELEVRRTRELIGKDISAIIISDEDNSLRVGQVIIFTSIKRHKKV